MSTNNLYQHHSPPTSITNPVVTSSISTSQSYVTSTNNRVNNAHLNNNNNNNNNNSQTNPSCNLTSALISGCSSVASDRALPSLPSPHNQHNNIFFNTNQNHLRTDNDHQTTNNNTNNTHLHHNLSNGTHSTGGAGNTLSHNQFNPNSHSPSTALLAAGLLYPSSSIATIPDHHKVVSPVSSDPLAPNPAAFFDYSSYAAAAQVAAAQASCQMGIAAAGNAGSNPVQSLHANQQHSTNPEMDFWKLQFFTS